MAEQSVAGIRHVPARAGSREPLDRQMRVLAIVVVSGAVMTVLDAAAVNVALDTVVRDLHGTLSSAQWIVTGYMLALALVVPVTGWATARFGPTRLWMLSLVLFLVGSVLCGVSWSISSLIFFRLVQGLGGGMIAPLAQTILARAAGPERMGRVMSMLGIATVLGPVIGPVLGGVLVQNMSWRWIFFINLPIGMLALAGAARVLPHLAGQLSERLDILGLVLASVGLVALTFGLSRVSGYGGFGLPATYGSMAIGMVLLVVFVLHSLRRGPTALIDIRLFADRGFFAASVALFLVGMSLFGFLLLLPLYYQSVRGQGAYGAGLLLIPQGVGVALALPLAGKLTDRFSARVVVAPGIVLMLVGTLAFTQVTASTSYLLLAMALVIRGLGMGMAMTPVTAAAYVLLPRDALARAISATNAIRQLGGSMGTALLAVMLIRNITHTATKATAPEQQAQLAHAYGQTFWVTCALIAIVLLPTLFLPCAPHPGQFNDTADD